jgi:hypothetical protein
LNEGSATRKEKKLLDDTLVQIAPVASSQSFTTTYMNWDKYKEYLYANLRPNTARLALKYGKKYSYASEHMDIKELLLVCSQPSKDPFYRSWVNFLG